MAAILQFRQGSKSSFISSGPYISEPFFDTDTNIIHIGVSGSSTITLTKLEDINSGSFSISGDYEGTNINLSGDLTASNALLSGDITVGGNLILGDQVQDNITVTGQFDSNLIPSASDEYDLGSTTKKWNVLYASRVDATELTGSIQVNNTILPDSNEVYDLGSPTQRFRDFYISSGSLRLGGHTISSPDNGNTVRFSGPRVQIGGLTGGRIEYNPTRSFLNLKGPSTDTSIPIVSSRMYLTGSNGEGYLEMGGDSNTMRFNTPAFQLGGNTGGRIRYNNTSNRIHFQGPTTDEPIPVVSSRVILSGSNGEINLEVGADGNLSSSNLDGSQTVGIYSGSFSGDGTELTFGGTGIISSSAQLTLLGFDGYNGWSADGDNSNSIYITSGRTLYFEGGDGITTEARNPGNYYITIDLDTGSAHFTDAVAGVGAPQGTVSGSQQVIDLLPSGTVSGSSQVINILDSLNTFTSSQESKNTLLETHTGSVNTSIDSLNSFTNSFDTAISLNSSDVTILGNLTVQGTQTQLNTATLNVEDLNILLASGSTTSAEADGAGITIDGANKSLIWNHGDSNFLFDAQVSSSVGFKGDGSNLTGVTADEIEYTNILNKPTLVSGSSQITYSDIDSIPQNIVSSSTQITTFLPSGVVSGSSQVEITQLSQINDTLFLQGTETWSSTDSLLITPFAVNKRFDTKGVISGSSQVEITQLSQINDTLFLQGTETWSSTDSLLITPFAVDKRLDSKGLLSGSGQLTPSLDLRYLEIDGDNVLSSSNENFTDYSESVDLRLENTLDSGTETSQSLHVLVGNFPTSGSLGTAAFYNVSSSLGDDGSVIPNVKAVYDYINNTIGAADITGVSASLGLFGGGNAGYVSLSLDTGSTHFQEGVELYSSDTTLPDGTISGSAQVITILNTESVVSGSAQITDFGFISESNSLYIDANDFSFGGTPQNSFGLNQITIRDDNTGYSGLLAFQDNTTVQSFDYVASPYRYIDTNTGIGIVLKPDADGDKSWIIDTDGDLVSNGGSWASGNAYMNNLIASSSVTASYILVDEDITANNFIGNIQATNGVVSGSSQLTSSFVDLTSTQTISGTKTFNDIVVNGTGSFARLDSVTGTAKIIGDAYIILNNDTPTERYAGIKVYDSGSANTTASLQFDGQTNDWFYEYDDGAIEYGVVMFGPEYSTKGAPTYPTNNTIQKGNGGHHLLDSNITDDGTTITLNSDTSVIGNISGSNIHSTGTVTAESDIVAYASSDRRLKDEIRPIRNSIDKINSIGGYSFVWNTEKQHIYKGKDYGVMAQEIEKILPELVDTRENGYKAVKYDRLVSLLIEGIKELSSEVKELKEKINRE